MDCQATPHFDVVEVKSSLINGFYNNITCLDTQKQAQQIKRLCLLTVL